MECFLCYRNENQVLLMALPVDIVYEDLYFQVVGNAEPNEFICLPCVGYQYDYLKEDMVG